MDSSAAVMSSRFLALESQFTRTDMCTSSDMSVPGRTAQCLVADSSLPAVLPQDANTSEDSYQTQDRTAQLVKAASPRLLWKSDAAADQSLKAPVQSVQP